MLCMRLRMSSCARASARQTPKHSSIALVVSVASLAPNSSTRSLHCIALALCGAAPAAVSPAPARIPRAAQHGTHFSVHVVLMFSTAYPAPSSAARSLNSMVSALGIAPALVSPAPTHDTLTPQRAGRRSARIARVSHVASLSPSSAARSLHCVSQALRGVTL